MKILLAASSSFGHINPCKSFYNFLKEKGHIVKVLGFKNQIEESAFPSSDLILLDAQNSFKKTIKNLKELKKYILEIVRIKKENNDFDLYLGFGGFINLVLLFLKKKKPLFIHEQNAVLGDTNKLIKPFSKGVFTSFKLNINREIYVGNPSTIDVKRREFTHNNKLKILFVFGSLGSRSLIEKLAKMDKFLDKNHEYYLVNGLSKKNRSTFEFANIKVLDYFDLKSNINNYDIIFSRGGATTLLEIIKSNTFLVSIPSPYVKNNHQEKNVDYLFTKGIIGKIKEENFTLESINNKINDYLNFDYHLTLYKRMNDYRFLDSNELIYKEICKYVKN